MLKVSRETIVSLTARPDRAVARRGEQFVLIETRVGGVRAGEIERVDQLLDQVERVQPSSEVEAESGAEVYWRPPSVHLRRVWFDRHNGGYSLFFDVLHDQNYAGQPTPAEVQQRVQEAFGDGEVDEDGQLVHVETRIQAVEEYFPDSAQFYETT